MTGRYIDSSVVVSAFDKFDTRGANELLTGGLPIFASFLVYVEVIRNLVRLESPTEVGRIESEFEELFARMNIVEIDDSVWFRAAAIARTTGVRSLDAVHLAAASVAGFDVLEIATFDRRLADAARNLGMLVVGAS